MNLEEFLAKTYSLALWFFENGGALKVALKTDRDATLPMEVIEPGITEMSADAVRTAWHTYVTNCAANN